AHGGHPAGRRARIPQAAGVGAAAGGLSHHPGRHLLSRRQPRRHGVDGDGAARAPVRADARAGADDLDQLGGQLPDHAAPRARPPSPDAAERELQPPTHPPPTSLPPPLPIPPVYSKVNPADAPILTLALTSDTLPLPKVEDLAETRLVQKIAELSGVGLVS